MAVDYEGNVLAASDYFTTDPQVMVADVPMQGVHTIYATIGDLFACVNSSGTLTEKENKAAFPRGFMPGGAAAAHDFFDN